MVFILQDLINRINFEPGQRYFRYQYSRLVGGVETSNVINLYEGMIDGTNDVLSTNIEGTINDRFLTTSSTFALDAYGSELGLARDGLDDDTYRERLRAYRSYKNNDFKVQDGIDFIEGFLGYTVLDNYAIKNKLPDLIIGENNDLGDGMWLIGSKLTYYTWYFEIDLNTSEIDDYLDTLLDITTSNNNDITLGLSITTPNEYVFAPFLKNISEELKKLMKVYNFPIIGGVR